MQICKFYLRKSSFVKSFLSILISINNILVLETLFLPLLIAFLLKISCEFCFDCSWLLKSSHDIMNSFPDSDVHFNVVE